MTFAAGVLVGFIAAAGLVVLIGSVMLITSSPDAEQATADLVDALRVVPLDAALREVMRRAYIDDEWHVVQSPQQLLFAVVLRCGSVERFDVLQRALHHELLSHTEADTGG